jgi:hypothetical protein
MNNSSTSNSDFARFIKRFFFHAFILACLVSVVFFIQLPGSYYFEIPRKTEYSKLSWVHDKLIPNKSWDSTVAFVGSSICLNGINDSLLNSWDTSNTSYVNLGITHSCFAMTDVLLEQMIIEQQIKPKKVMLCFKGDAMNRNLHNLFPLAASPGQIIQSGLDGNTQVVSSFLHHAAWNIHAATGIFKLADEKDELEFNSDFGFKPQKTLSRKEIEKAYQRLRTGSEANFNAIEAETNGKALGIKTKLFLMQADIFQNIRFQRNSFERSARLLENAGIPFDIIVYPNLVSARMGKPYIMADYIKRTFTSIDFTKHQVIAVDDTCFANSGYYVDMNHLNPAGAEQLTRFIYHSIQPLP